MAKIHIHTKYSLLDAIIEPEELVKKIKEQDGDNACLCVTEHGNVYSCVEVYKLCKKYKVKYLLGCEMYICNDVKEKSKNSKYSHLVVIAKNEQGRMNLNKLISISSEHKYYGKPRIDFELLKQYKDGLVVSSACMAGEIQKSLILDDIEDTKKIVQKYKEVFGDDYYLEYQSHSCKEQQELNRKVVDLANEMNVKYIVTTDAHYLNKDDQKYHSIFVKIGSVREVGETYNDCYLQSDEEILKICKSTTKEENLIALKNTQEIADKCNVELPLSAPIMPHNEIPKEFNNEMAYLKHLCKLGWMSKNIDQKKNKKEYKERLIYELNAIQKMGFEGYFILVRSYCNSTQRRGIARGSAGGSLVCYLTNITDIDPIEYGLYFERFIDVGALDLLENGEITKNELKIPDIDSDFGTLARQSVLDYVVRKYTKSNVASLGTFQYIWAKGALKDIGKVLGIPFEVTNKMTKNLNNETIKEALDLGLLDEYVNKYPELFEYAKRLAGLPKSFGSHPCGVVISTKNIDYFNAIDYNDGGMPIIQGDMHTAEDLGLIKADFLGLRTVDVIYDVLEIIGKDYEYIAPHNINLADKDVYKEFREGYTNGIFQFESSGMKHTLKNMEASCIDDLIVANALYRPGSMKYIENYANRKKGEETFEYIHQDLEPILKNTYGIMVFQEQLIEIGRLAKLRNPDKLRKATAKKKAELLDEVKPELKKGLNNRGWSDEQFEELWNNMLDFAKYSFNRAHAASYGLIAYICMYLKHYHTKEFMCAWINSVKDKTDKVKDCIEECKRLGIKIYLGKYNNCCSLTKLYKDGIMLGVSVVKSCNSTIADELMSLNQNKYTSFVELLRDINEHTNINSRQLDCLVKLDFFSDFGDIGKLLKIIEYYNGKKEKNKVIIQGLSKSSSIKKDKIPIYVENGISEYLIKQFSSKETDKTYSQIDGLKLLDSLIKTMKYDTYSMSNIIRSQNEILGYVLYKNQSVSKDLFCIEKITDNKYCKDKPFLDMYNIQTGKSVKGRIKDSNLFQMNRLKEGTMIKLTSCNLEFKKKKVDENTWVKTDERECVLTGYEVISENE